MKNLRSYSIFLCLASTLLVSVFMIPVSSGATNSMSATQVKSFEYPYDRQKEVQFGIKDGSDWFEYPSSISRQDLNYSESFSCPNWGANDCTANLTSENWITANVVLPICELVPSGPCIESLEIGSSSTGWSSANFVRNISGPTHEAVPEINYPYGSTISLWQNNATNHEGKSGYFSVQVAISSTQTLGKNLPFTFNRLAVNIVPTNLVTGKWKDQAIISNVSSSGKRNIGYTTFQDNHVWEENDTAGESANWIEGTGART